MKDHGDQKTFRAWLVKQLTLTRWSASPDTTPEALARKLGVRADVLVEAIALRREKALRRGRAKSAGLLERRDYVQINVRMPAEIRKHWQALCQELQLMPSTIIRSLLHQFLLTKKRPQSIAAWWIYKGKVVHVARGLVPAKTRVSRGAAIALRHYADEWGVSSEAIARGLVGDLLEGRLKGFRPVAFSELWGDPDRYLHPEKFS